jgi:hypothetical protein
MSGASVRRPVAVEGVAPPGDLWLHGFYGKYRPDTLGTDEPLRVVVLLGSADISGGTYVVFQHARYWMGQGADVTIATILPARRASNVWHPALQELRFCTVDELGDEPYDVAIATWWRTVYELPKVRARHVLYFVQSEEARFYAGGEDEWASPFAELTYRFDLPTVTIARWLQAFLAFEHRRPSFLVQNGIDKQRYQPFGPVVEPRVPGRLRVLVEGPIDVPMKNVAASIELARQGGADEVWLMTSSNVTEYPKADRVLSQVPIDHTGAVYRSCDVLLKLSRVEGMYGPPLEMYHCGGTVVTYDVTGSEEYVEHGVNGLVVPMDDEQGVVDAVSSLKTSPDLLRELQFGAVRTAQDWPDWERSSREFWFYLRALARQPAADNLVTMLALQGAAVP